MKWEDFKKETKDFDLEREPSPFQNRDFRLQKDHNWTLISWILRKLGSAFEDFTNMLQKKMDDYDKRFNDQIAKNTKLDEVIDARRPKNKDAYDTLGNRLDDMPDNDDLANTNNAIDNVNLDALAIDDGVVEPFKSALDTFKKSIDESPTAVRIGFVTDLHYQRGVYPDEYGIGITKGLNHIQHMGYLAQADDVDISGAGRNLLLGSSDDIVLKPTDIAHKYYILYTDLVPGTKYTFSAEASLTGAEDNKVTVSVFNDGHSNVLLNNYNFVADKSRQTWNFTAPENAKELIIYSGRAGATNNIGLTLHHYKLEKGPATPWAPAPEDIAGKLDLVVFNGDNVHGREMKDATEKRIKQLVSTTEFALDDTPVIYTVGNHDDNNVYFDGNNKIEQSIPMKELLQDFNIKKDYDYKDFPNQNLRVIVLDAFENPEIYDNQGYQKYPRSYNSVFSQNQLNWLIDALKVPSGYHVFITMHCPPLGYFGNQPYGNNFKNVNHDLMLGILRAFINGSKYQANGTNSDYPAQIAADFTSQGKGTLIGIATGHEHNDGGIKVANGIRVINRTANFPAPNNVGRNVGTIDEDAFDVIEIDTSKKHVKFNRFGSGSSLEFNY